MQKFKGPMLAAKVDAAKLVFPLMASPKIDGVRVTCWDRAVLTRSLKDLPNNFVRGELGLAQLHGMDGELVVGPANDPAVFRTTSSGVMSHEGEPRFTLHVFDLVGLETFKERFTILQKVVKQVRVIDQLKIEVVPHQMVMSMQELSALEEHYLAEGYEGLMLRNPQGQYKHGRSTVSEGGLLKLKRFLDAEAEILSVQQLMHNTNEAKRNATGHLERSSHQAGKVGLAQLGALHVRDLKTKVAFDIGTGFTLAQRKELWKMRSALKGKIVNYRYFAGGVKDKPRFPVFHGFRDRLDL